jgi:hypothetical protein
MKKLLLLVTLCSLTSLAEANLKKKSVNAGPDQTVAQGEVVHLSGTSDKKGTYLWTTNGTGTFSSPNSLVTDYTPSAVDVQNGGAQLTLTNRNGKLSDSMNLYITSCATVDGGNDITACGYAYGGELSLQATTSNNSGSVTWSTNGYGGFDDPQSLTPIYFYHYGDVNLANIEIYVTLHNEGCDDDMDTVQVYLQAGPYLEFPEPSVSQNGSDPVPASVNMYGYASSGVWTTTGSGTFADPSSTYTSYYPSSDDALNGCVELIFTTNDPEGECGPATGSMSACFNYIPPCPEISIGNDITICGYSSGGAISLQANVSGNADGIFWGSSGTGGFDDPNSFNPTYYYDANDVNNAQIEISATVTNSGCSASDALTVYLHAGPELVFPEPNVYGGCSGGTVYANVYLYGYASSGTWSTTGFGTFDDPNSTFTAYHSSPDDNGCVLLMFSTNDPEGPCGSTTGAMEACFDNCSETSTAKVDPEMSLYPNPAKDQMEIETKGKFKKSETYITDLSGNKVKFTWSGKTIIISDLLPGQYVLHTVSDGRPRMAHFVKL